MVLIRLSELVLGCGRAQASLSAQAASAPMDGTHNMGRAAHRARAGGVGLSPRRW